MTSESAAPPNTAPDRLFARSAAILLGVFLLLVAGSHVALDRLTARQARSAELATIGVGQAAAARKVLESLERIGELPPGPKERAAYSGLVWALDRLVKLESQRSGLGLIRSPAETSMADLIAASEETVRLAPQDLGAAAARSLHRVFAVRILPKLELAAERLETDAARSAATTRLALGASLLAHLALVMTLAGLVVLPTRNRIRVWVEKTRETDQENRFRLLHDPLTQMPNATYLHAYLGRLASGADRTSRHTAVLRIDLDRFKVLRETLGQRIADEIIRISARRIQNAMRAGDFAAYLGQADFVVVAGELEDANAAAQIAQRVQQSLMKPFAIRDGARRIGCSIGVTLMADDQPEPDRMLANAEIALDEAQAAGAGNVRYFRESLRQEIERRETLFTELLSGLERGELIPYFQPQIDIGTGSFSGFEALVRWEHPRHGLLTPAAFLDFADETDLTERIGEVMVSKSLAALRAWDAAGLNVPRVGINFALAQLRDPRLIEKIKWEVERLDLEPARLAIEVLETVLIKSDTDLVVRNIRGLASAGFEIELDDFGTGHASISNLRRFMVNRIKIDRSFIFGIETSQEQQTLTSSMIAMARALGIRTLAEGVETEDAEAILRSLGCDNYQGFLVSKPMSQAETFHWLRSFHPRRIAAKPRKGTARSDPNTP